MSTIVFRSRCRARLDRNVVSIERECSRAVLPVRATMWSFTSATHIARRPHGENFQRAEAFVIGDLDKIVGAKDVAAKVNALGYFDAVIHNAAVGYRVPQRVTADGLPHLFAINTLSAYILTASIARPKRLLYFSSGCNFMLELTSMTFFGRSVAGTAQRHMRRASCTTP
jgi:hypothetical protein